MRIWALPRERPWERKLTIIEQAADALEPHAGPGRLEAGNPAAWLPCRGRERCGQAAIARDRSVFQLDGTSARRARGLE